MVPQGAGDSQAGSCAYGVREVGAGATPEGSGATARRRCQWRLAELRAHRPRPQTLLYRPPQPNPRPMPATRTEETPVPKLVGRLRLYRILLAASAILTLTVHACR